MGNVIAVPCRSYPAQSFDGCPACVSAALDAVTQAGMYVLGRAAPGLVGQAEGRVEVSYRIKVRLYDEDGAEMAADEMEAEQAIEEVPAEPEDSTVAPIHRLDTDSADNAPETTMRLDDFQTVLDCVTLEPGGVGGMRGSITGKLFGYERLIGSFALEVEPGR